MVRKEEEDQGCAFQMAVGWNILDNERKDPTVKRLKVLARSMQFLKGGGGWDAGKRWRPCLLMMDRHFPS